MSKIRQNYTVGIRLPWTLSSEDNWDKTHRLAGKLWIVGGVLVLFNVFLKWTSFSDWNFISNCICSDGIFVCLILEREKIEYSSINQYLPINIGV